MEKICNSSPIAGRGTFVANGCSLRKGEALGFYEGTVTEGEGPYTMTLFAKSKPFNVDASPMLNARESLLGSINEDLYADDPNYIFRQDGLCITLRECGEGEELVTRYEGKYNWDYLKNKVLLF